jgi:hypothetical protein
MLGCQPDKHKTKYATGWEIFDIGSLSDVSFYLFHKSKIRVLVYMNNETIFVTVDGVYNLFNLGEIIMDHN